MSENLGYQITDSQGFKLGMSLGYLTLEKWCTLHHAGWEYFWKYRRVCTSLYVKVCLLGSQALDQSRLVLLIFVFYQSHLQKQQNPLYSKLFPPSLYS